MKNSFNFVAEEQENEDCGSDGGRRNKRLIGKAGAPGSNFNDNLSTNKNIMNKGGIGSAVMTEQSPALKEKPEDAGAKDSTCQSHGQIQFTSQQTTPFKMGAKNE